MGFRRWVVVQRAMRQHRPLPPPILAPVLVATLLGIAVATLLWLATR